MSNDLPGQLQAERVRLHMSLHQVAAVTGHKDPSLLGKWERGAVSPTLANVGRWAAALGMQLVLAHGPDGPMEPRSCPRCGAPVGGVGWNFCSPPCTRAEMRERRMRKRVDIDGNPGLEAHIEVMGHITGYDHDGIARALSITDTSVLAYLRAWCNGRTR